MNTPFVKDIMMFFRGTGVRRILEKVPLSFCPDMASVPVDMPEYINVIKRRMGMKLLPIDLAKCVAKVSFCAVGMSALMTSQVLLVSGISNLSMRNVR